MTDDSGEIGPNLVQSKSGLHELFSEIFPNQVQQETGDKLNGLLFIDENGPIVYSENRDRLAEEFGLSTNEGLRRAVNSMTDLGLIIEENNELATSRKGEKVIESLSMFVDSYCGNLTIDDSIETLDVACYDNVEVKVYTDGEDYADYLWIWELENNEEEPIESIEYTASSGGSNIDDWSFKHSSEISNYEITTHQGDFVIFEIEFGNPIHPGESTRYWYSYRLNRNLHPDWKPLRFVYNCREYPVKELFVDIINENYFDIKKNSLKHRVELPSKKSRLGPYRKIKYDYTPLQSFNNLNFRAVNIPVGAAIDLIWDFEYDQ